MKARITRQMRSISGPLMFILMMNLCYCTVPQEPVPVKVIECKRDLWIIDTHQVDDCDCDIAKARFLRLDDNCKCVEESEQSFLATLDPAQIVNYLLPGYMTNVNLSVEHLWSFHLKLEEQVRCRGLRCSPTRLVMWDWPSELSRLKIKKDAQEKAHRSNIEGYWLAQHLAKLPQKYRANLVAHSFGARIATSAAHHLAGGERCGCPILDASNSPRLSGTLIASAVDTDWISNCQPHSLALNRFERLLLVNNSRDRMLKLYRRLDRSKRHIALGAVGLLSPEAQYASHVRQWDVTDIVGRAHVWHRHVDSPEIMWEIAQYAFYAE